MSSSVHILIPVYKEALNLLEQFSLDYLLTKATGRRLKFVAPIGLDSSYYRNRYPDITFELFDSHYFSSIAGYNQLLLSEYFYIRFLDCDFILIHQTDALMFRDDLDIWMGLGYDYIGAPWPQGMALNLSAQLAERYGGVQFHAFVGNGGFSLRNIRKSLGIIQSECLLREFWTQNGLNEDCFFAFAGLLTDKFSIPHPAMASRFALELEPEHYVATNGGDLPVGCHAWWKHDLAFWQKVISTVG